MLFSIEASAYHQNRTGMQYDTTNVMYVLHSNKRKGFTNKIRGKKKKKGTIAKGRGKEKGDKADKKFEINLVKSNRN